MWAGVNKLSFHSDLTWKITENWLLWKNCYWLPVMFFLASSWVDYLVKIANFIYLRKDLCLAKCFTCRLLVRKELLSWTIGIFHEISQVYVPLNLRAILYLTIRRRSTTASIVSGFKSSNSKSFNAPWGHMGPSFDLSTGLVAFFPKVSLNALGS